MLNHNQTAKTNNVQDSITQIQASPPLQLPSAPLALDLYRTFRLSRSARERTPHSLAPLGSSLSILLSNIPSYIQQYPNIPIFLNRRNSLLSSHFE